MCPTWLKSENLRHPNSFDSEIAGPIWWLIIYQIIETTKLCNCFALCLYSREGNGTPLQYSCLENPMDGGAWWAAVRGVTKSRTQLRDFTFTFHFHALEKGMATHSSVLAWRIPGMAEPGGRPSMWSHRVGHDWIDLAAAACLYSLTRKLKVILLHWLPPH